METVLVLEDEPINLKVIALALRLDGYRVLEAADGNAAIQICNEDRKPIHLLVADVQVPGISGTVVALELLSLWPEIAILFTSGTPVIDWAPHDLAGLDYLSGAAVDFLEKPFSPLTLGNKVRQLLARPRERGASFLTMGRVIESNREQRLTDPRQDYSFHPLSLTPKWSAPTKRLPLHSTFWCCIGACLVVLVLFLLIIVSRLGYVHR
jgi:DNA-binding response OmpR family regulator